MPSISGNFNPHLGVLTNVFVARIIKKDPRSEAAEVIQMESFLALLDTGATKTCISELVSEKLNLLPIGKTQMIGATGEQVVNQYHFAIGFPLSSQQDARGLQVTNIDLKLVTGLQFSSLGTGFDVLIGRDILCQGIFTMSFDGHFNFAY